MFTCLFHCPQVDKKGNQHCCNEVRLARQFGDHFVPYIKKAKDKTGTQITAEVNKPASKRRGYESVHSIPIRCL